MSMNRLFCIAAAALMMAACSSEDLTQQTKVAQMQFSATIAAPNASGGTRTAYTEDTQNKKISVAWEVNDEIALVHNSVKDVVKVKTVNADGSATINGTITGATDEAAVQLFYPAASVNVNGDGNPVFDEDVYGNMLKQDGTLKYIQDNLDFRQGEGKISVPATGDASLKANVDVKSKIAIWRIEMSDSKGQALYPTTLSMKVGEEMVAKAEMAGEGSVNYLCLIPELMGDGQLSIEATKSDDTYSYTLEEGVKLEEGKYYHSVIEMEKAVTSVTLTSSELVLVIGEADVTLTCKVLPEDADAKTVTWTSSNPAVATVDATTDNAKGTVHAVAEGTATITAQAGDKTATCTVTVKIPGLLDGKFSVSSTKQVQFSQGNLQAEVAGGKFNDYDFTASSWMFAEHQWDYLGNADNSNMFYINKLVDLFGWVGSSAFNNTYGLCRYDSNDTHYYGSTNDALKSDWGTVAITNGGKTSNYGWRTLTKDEWAYLFETRTTTSGIRYAKATVNGKSGVILLPDDWSTSYYALASTNTADATYTSNEINADDWTSAFEAHGVVFLPAAGYRKGTTLYHPGDYGCYWSSSSTSYNAYQVEFNSSNVSSKLDSSSISERQYGCSVRLVKDVE